MSSRQTGAPSQLGSGATIHLPGSCLIHCCVGHVQWLVELRELPVIGVNVTSIVVGMQQVTSCLASRAPTPSAAVAEFHVIAVEVLYWCFLSENPM